MMIQDYGARVDVINSLGSTVLINACENEDVDPRVLSLILSLDSDVNRRRNARTLKWKTIDMVALAMKNHSSLMLMLARNAGATALHQAVMRGDVECVEILLSHGADPSVENYLG